MSKIISRIRVTGLRLLLCLLLVTVSRSGLAEDEWGSWDDLPDDLFDKTELGDDSSPDLEELLAGDGVISAEALTQWLNELDDRLILSDEEFEDLLEDLEGEDIDEVMEELEEWLEDQADELEDELEDLNKELDDDELDDDSTESDDSSDS